jgi:hypothetical protein
MMHVQVIHVQIISNVSILEIPIFAYVDHHILAVIVKIVDNISTNDKKNFF